MIHFTINSCLVWVSEWPSSLSEVIWNPRKHNLLVLNCSNFSWISQIFSDFFGIFLNFLNFYDFYDFLEFCRIYFYFLTKIFQKFPTIRQCSQWSLTCLYHTHSHTYLQLSCFFSLNKSVFCCSLFIFFRTRENQNTFTWSNVIFFPRSRKEKKKPVDKKIKKNSEN
jgi:hypothetical protein